MRIKFLIHYAKPITIKDNCWLASNVVVCGGVTIGKGCVIGAGSVVNIRHTGKGCGYPGSVHGIPADWLMMVPGW